jgi:hypothetical protein
LAERVVNGGRRRRRRRRKKRKRRRGSLRASLLIPQIQQNRTILRYLRYQQIEQSRARRMQFLLPSAS